MKFAIEFGIELAIVRARQFLTGVAEHSAEGGIGFQNPAIEPANSDSQRGPFKHREKAQIAIVIERRRKLGYDVHVESGLRSQVSGRRKSKF